MLGFPFVRTPLAIQAGFSPDLVIDPLQEEMSEGSYTHIFTAPARRITIGADSVKDAPVKKEAPVSECIERCALDSAPRELLDA